MRCSNPVPKLLLFLDITTGKHDCAKTQSDNNKFKFQKFGER